MESKGGTYLDLEIYLSEFLRALFKERVYGNSNGEAVRLRHYVGDVPKRKGKGIKPDDEEIPEPYTLSKVVNGSIDLDNDDDIVTAVVIFCVCDTDDDNLIATSGGHDSVVSMIYRVKEALQKRPVLAGRFAVEPEIEWTVPDNDTPPYSFGGMKINFRMKSAERDDPYI